MSRLLEAELAAARTRALGETGPDGSLYVLGVAFDHEITAVLDVAAAALLAGQLDRARDLARPVLYPVSTWKPVDLASFGYFDWCTAVVLRRLLRFAREVTP